MGAWVRVTVAVVVLSGGILLLQHLSHGEAIPLRRSFDEFPSQIAAYRGAEEGLEPDVLTKLGVTDFLMRRYEAVDRASLWLYVGYYASQRTGIVIHSPKQCLPGNGWNIVRTERAVIEVPGSARPAVIVNRVVVAKGGDRQLVLYWYQERGRVVASEYWGKAYMVWDSITRTRTDGALVRVSGPIVGSEEDAFREAAEFSRRILPLLAEFLPA